MAVIDLGEWNDIHPWQEERSGERLALAAQKSSIWGEGYRLLKPTFFINLRESKTIRSLLRSVNGRSGFSTTNDGEEFGEFAWRKKSDKKFVWAKAKIEGDKVIVWRTEASNPMYVRYAWVPTIPLIQIIVKKDCRF